MRERKKFNNNNNNLRRAFVLVGTSLLVSSLNVSANDDLPSPASETASSASSSSQGVKLDYENDGSTTTTTCSDNDNDVSCTTTSNVDSMNNDQNDILPNNYFAPDVTVADYGVDVSWPIHRVQVSTNYPWLPHNLHPDTYETPEEYKDMPIQPLGNRAQIYDEFMEGCREWYGKRGHKCDVTEKERTRMSLDQPKKMTNYTELGFKKIKAPDAVFQLIKEFWETNRNHGNGKPEKWGIGYTYTNHWVTNSTMVSVEDNDMIGGGFEFKDKIWGMAQDTISEWVGRPLQTSSLYGIRVYHEGAILATHVDRLPLVSSAIINVDQDPDMVGDWPLEVYGHDGRVYNVTMKPGDMVLYESHSLLHGRPFALPGKFYANIFIHFEPVPLWNTARLAQLGDLESLQQAAEEDRQSLFKTDENNWQPLHEATRAGHLEVVRFLLEQGANVNSETKGGKYALDWAHESDKNIQNMIKLLREYGGLTRVEYDAQSEHSSEDIKDEL